MPTCMTMIQCSSSVSFTRSSALQAAHLLRHLLAGLAPAQYHWPAVSLPLKHFHSRLHHAVGATNMMLPCMHELLAPASADGSAALVAFYRSEIVKNEKVSLLSVIAAAAHCGGGCSEQEACQQAVRLLAHVPWTQRRAPQHTDQVFAEQQLELAAQVCANPAGPGSGAAGCACRTQLSAALMGSTCRWQHYFCTLQPRRPGTRSCRLRKPLASRTGASLLCRA
jgi:hypothetical protein